MNGTFVAKLELGQTSPSLTSLFRLAEGLDAEPFELVLALQARYLKERARSRKP